MKLEDSLIKRPQRLRKSKILRNLVQETRLHIDDFIYPIFVTEGKNKEVESMPGIYNWTLNEINREIDSLLEHNINKILLFGIPNVKNSSGSYSYSDNGIIQKTLQKLKNEYPDLFIVTDVCFCEYSDHGHCGILDGKVIDNDKTIDLLSKQAISFAKNGSDMIAPSAMMDGMVCAIRNSLDYAGYKSIPIMSYSVKYASSFYGPFRDAAECAPQFGNRKGYQMDPPNKKEALKEVRQDIKEGADIIMVKPSLSYLDIVTYIEQNIDIPIACYNVSGEYSMLKAAAEKGWLDYDLSIYEILLSMKRAGANIIISYAAKEVAKILRA